ncbi:MAG TPA: GIY-YIG nuclease family protein [Symbiobacteriaceae bacterium]|nr:GIY-YIG nuclease family protein [Symbiobacteriaceae bacterium]
MDRKELKRQAMEMKTESGVYQIRNLSNGKLFVDSTRNFKTLNGQKFMLEMGSHRNKALQLEWNQLGPDAFVFEVVEMLKKPEEGYFDEVDALKKLKAKWMEQLQPYGERGYHRSSED